MNTEQKTFALVHGSWHDKWCWELLQAELTRHNQDSVAMDIPVDDPHSNFEDYGDAVVDALRGKEHIVGVFHSRAGNYGPRAVNKLMQDSARHGAFERMIFLAASFEPATLVALGRPADHEDVPDRNDPESRKAIIPRPDLGDDMTVIDRSAAAELLYHDVDEASLIIKALDHLRPQRRSPHEVAMQHWPAIPQHYIVCRDDKMVRPEWSYYASRNWLGIEPIELEGGHSPFLSRPQALAHLLVEIACGQAA